MFRLFHAIEDVFAVGKAANILGVKREDWKIESFVESKVDIEEHKPVFGCEACEIIFKSERCLNTHKGKHVSTSPATTPDVVNSFAQIFEGNKCSCNLCSYTSRDKYNMRLHQEGKHGLGPGYNCKFCDKSFKTNQDLSKHKPFCDPSLSSKTAKSRNVGKKVFFCDVCGLSFKSRVFFNGHKRFKHTLTPNRSLEQQAVDAFSKRVEGRRYECNLCTFTSRDKYNIGLHLERKHGLSPGYKCSVCNKNLKTKQDLSQHQLRKEC